MKFGTLMFALSLLFAPLLLAGCGGSGGGLATDSGEMTIEEYQQMEKASEAALDSAPPEMETGPK